jgi:hypothetical protein
MNAIAQAVTREPARREILARQGLRLPAVILKHLRFAGIYCQPTIAVEHQRVARKWVLRGLESGGAVADVGAYTSFVGPDGGTLCWLQKVDSIGVNAVHAVTIAPIMLRLEMIRIGRTYDLLITRHSLAHSEANRRPRLESSILFYGRRGTLEMELWGEDARFRGAVCPIFYSRSGEILPLPSELVWAVARLTMAVCCVGCRHCHLLEAALFEALSAPEILEAFNEAE